MLAKLRDAMRSPDVGVMDAFSKILFGREIRGLSLVSDYWFGTDGGPQWLWDSVLSTGQMHLVMKEATARIAELLLAGAGPVQYWLQCGHPKFRMVIAWDGATEADTKLTEGNWKPKNINGPVRLWVFVPFNSGYGMKSGYGSTENPTAEAVSKLADLNARVVAAGNKPELMNPMMTLHDLDEIVDGYPLGMCPWRRHPLALKPDNDQDLDRRDLAITHLPSFAEPPPTMPNDRHRQEDIWTRKTSAIEVSWQTTRTGHLIYHGRQT